MAKNHTNTLISSLINIVGTNHVLVDPKKKEPYCQGFRFGSGNALAVIKPGSLIEIWQVLKHCTEADTAIIMQAANTGLTGGSTPHGNDYDRPIIIISTMRVDGIQLINHAKQAICLAGSTLFELESQLAPHHREPHSVIGSSCIGASIIGGVCNNSGGSLVHRGPAYTELALFAQINAQGELCLVNNLGIELGSSPEEMLRNLELQHYAETDIQHPNKLASDHDYSTQVRDIDADTPARFNSDQRRLHEASGCTGKLAVFAVRLDTFPKAKQEKVFYIGTNDPNVMANMRRDILSTFKTLPISGEFFDRTCYEISQQYGKDTFFVIDKLGSKYIPKFFALKRTVDRLVSSMPWVPSNCSDRIMQWLSKLLPNHLPKRMENFKQRYQWHFIVEAHNAGIDETNAYLEQFFQAAEGDFFVCTDNEAKKAMLHRFVIGGAIGRYHTLHRAEHGDMMTIDVALRRNEQQWLKELPIEIDQQIVTRFYYGHFFCHVLHLNYIMQKTADAKSIKQTILESFDRRGAQYPAEHNVGHEYFAKPHVRKFYRRLDPTNTFNPGIGKTSKRKDWS